jgi:uncharacterized repeat protein (TIGR03803 family)
LESGEEMNTEKLTLRKLGGRGRICAVLLFCVAATLASQAQSFKVLATFPGTDSTFGAQPNGLLAQGFDGNLYGTTVYGGDTGGFGNVYRITRGGTLTSIYSFCTGGNCPDGKYPSGGLVLGADGNFYGTTASGGSSCDQSLGTVFKITPQGGLTTLHSFQSTDGFSPSGLVQASDGNVYGTATYGGSGTTGCNGGGGTVFRITPEGEFTVLHSFCLQSACADGEGPRELVEGSDGNLYGHTASGGVDGSGTLFRITPAGALTTFYSFDDTDGSPFTALVEAGNSGDFYGATADGGNPTYGMFFKVTEAGDLTTIYSFCSQTNCADGYLTSGFTQGTDGNFYGANLLGGSTEECLQGCGTLFEITPTGTLTTLHTFCTGECLEGAWPSGGLLQATDGKFYGTTSLGYETIFRLSTGLAPFVKLLRNSGKEGACVNLLGQGFEGTTGVFLNGTPVSFTVDSDTHISGHVPVGATSGYVTVDTPSGTLTSNVVFQVTPGTN